jgi:hypothetical protein
VPALDQCHPQVVHALEKAGWRVVFAPYVIHVDDKRAFADMILSKGTNGTSEQMIVLEVKCFPAGRAFTHELYNALGQYLVYREMMRLDNAVVPLFLSIPIEVFNSDFDTIVMETIRSNQIRLLVINLEKEEIDRWIP